VQLVKPLVKPLVVAVVAAAAVLLVGSPAEATPVYTHTTTLTQDCMIHANYPKAGVPDWGWVKTRVNANGSAYHVGVRYSVNQYYSLVEDYARTADPHWGFMASSCLTDPHAYNGTTQLGDRQGVGGDGATKTVPFQPAAGSVGKTVQVNGYGTLRSAAQSFVIGNIQNVDTFRIETATCGVHSPESWIRGYAPNSGRWGYVQAQHLSGCT
jgi:hypothetical protein